MKQFIPPEVKNTENLIHSNFAIDQDGKISVAYMGKLFLATALAFQLLSDN